MSEALDRERNRVFIAVKNGRMAPEEAEALAKEKGFERFEATPDPSAFDPMTEAEWTLPMAAAWFIWRSPDAVRDQWDLARKGWKKWVPRPTSPPAV